MTNATKSTMRVKAACDLTGLTRHAIYQLVERGFLTRRLANIATPKGRGVLLLFVDELEKLIEVSNTDMTQDRQLAAMKTYRRKMRRL